MYCKYCMISLMIQYSPVCEVAPSNNEERDRPFFSLLGGLARSALLWRLLFLALSHDSYCEYGVLVLCAVLPRHVAELINNAL